jgi:WD40 repeat protein
MRTSRRDDEDDAGFAASTIVARRRTLLHDDSDAQNEQSAGRDHHRRGGHGGGTWELDLEMEAATLITSASFSPDGRFFATCGKFDRLAKVWYSVSSTGSMVMTYLYLPHPRSVLGLEWAQPQAGASSGKRQATLLTSCRDGIFRIWVESFADGIPQFYTCGVLETPSRSPYAVAAWCSLLPRGSSSAAPSSSAAASSSIVVASSSSAAAGGDAATSTGSSRPKGAGGLVQSGTGKRFVGTSSSLDISWVLALEPDGSATVWEITGLDDRPRCTPRIVVWASLTAALDTRGWLMRRILVSATVTRPDLATLPELARVNVFVQDVTGEMRFCEWTVPKGSGTMAPEKRMVLSRFAGSGGHHGRVVRIREHPSLPCMGSLSEKGELIVWGMTGADAVTDPPNSLRHAFSLHRDCRAFTWAPWGMSLFFADSEGVHLINIRTSNSALRSQSTEVICGTLAESKNFGSFRFLCVLGRARKPQRDPADLGAMTDDTDALGASSGAGAAAGGGVGGGAGGAAGAAAVAPAASGSGAAAGASASGAGGASLGDGGAVSSGADGGLPLGLDDLASQLPMPPVSSVASGAGGSDPAGSEAGQTSAGPAVGALPTSGGGGSSSAAPSDAHVGDDEGSRGGREDPTLLCALTADGKHAVIWSIIAPKGIPGPIESTILWQWECRADDEDDSELGPGGSSSLHGSSLNTPSTLSTADLNSVHPSPGMGNAEHAHGSTLTLGAMALIASRLVMAHRRRSTVGRSTLKPPLLDPSYPLMCMVGVPEVVYKKGHSLSVLTASAAGVVSMLRVSPSTGAVDVVTSFSACAPGTMVSIACPYPGRVSCVSGTWKTGYTLRTHALEAATNTWTSEWEATYPPSPIPPIVAWEDIGGGCFAMAVLAADPSGSQHATVLAPKGREFSTIVEYRDLGHVGLSQDDPRSEKAALAFAWTGAANLVCGAGASLIYASRHVQQRDSALPTETVEQAIIRSSASLPAFHPRILTEFLMANELAAVKRILTHLHSYVAGLYAAREARGESAPSAIFAPELSLREIFLDEDPDDADALVSKDAAGGGGGGGGGSGGGGGGAGSSSNNTAAGLFDSGDQDRADDLGGFGFGSYEPELDTFSSSAAAASAAPAAPAVTVWGEDMARSLRDYLSQTQLFPLDRVEQMSLLSVIDATLLFGDRERSLDPSGLRYLVSYRLQVMQNRSLTVKERSSKPLGWLDIAWAFHSDQQDFLLDNSLNAVAQLTWPAVRMSGAPLWIRSLTTLKALAEKLAKAQFAEKKDPMDCMLVYLALGKKPALTALFKAVKNVKLTEFLSHDFSTPEWQEKALKNAYALMSQHNFEKAASFVLLAGRPVECVRLLVDKVHDLMLATFVARLAFGDGSADYTAFLDRLLTSRPPETLPPIDTQALMASGGPAAVAAAERAAAKTPMPAPLVSVIKWIRGDKHAAVTVLKDGGDSNNVGNLILYRYLAKSAVVKILGTISEDPLSETIDPISRYYEANALHILAVGEFLNLAQAASAAAAAAAAAQLAMAKKAAKKKAPATMSWGFGDDDDNDGGGDADDDMDDMNELAASLHGRASHPQHQPSYILSESIGHTKIRLTSRRLCALTKHLAQCDPAERKAREATLCEDYLFLCERLQVDREAALVGVRRFIENQLQVRQAVALLTTAHGPDATDLAAPLIKLSRQINMIPAVLGVHTLSHAQARGLWGLSGELLSLASSTPASCLNGVPAAEVVVAIYLSAFLGAWVLGDYESVRMILEHPPLPGDEGPNPSPRIYLVGAKDDTPLSAGSPNRVGGQQHEDDHPELSSSGQANAAAAEAAKGDEKKPEVPPSPPGAQQPEDGGDANDANTNNTAAAAATAATTPAASGPADASKGEPASSSSHAGAGATSSSPGASRRSNNNNKMKLPSPVGHQWRTVFQTSVSVEAGARRPVLPPRPDWEDDEDDLPVRKPAKPAAAARADGHLTASAISALSLSAFVRRLKWYIKSFRATFPHDDPTQQGLASTEMALVEWCDGVIKAARAAALAEEIERQVLEQGGPGAPLPMFEVDDDLAASVDAKGYFRAASLRTEGRGGQPDEALEAGEAAMHQKRLLYALVGEAEGPQVFPKTDQGLSAALKLRGPVASAPANAPVRLSFEDPVELYKSLDVILTFCLDPSKEYLALSHKKGIREFTVYDSILFKSELGSDEKGQWNAVKHRFEKLPEVTLFLNTARYVKADAQAASGRLRSSPAPEPEPDRPYTTFASHPELPIFLSCGFDGAMTLRRFNDRLPLVTFDTSTASQASSSGGSSSNSSATVRINQVRFSPYGNKVGACDSAGYLRLWELQPGEMTPNHKPFEVFKCHKDCRDFAFLSSFSFLATLGENENGAWSVSLWDTLLPAGKAFVHSCPMDQDGAVCMAFSHTHLTLLLGGRKGLISVYDLRERAIVKTLASHTNLVQSLSISPDGSFFASGSVDGDIRLWDMNSLTELKCFTGIHPQKQFFYPTIKGTTPMSEYGVRKVEVTREFIYSCGADGRILRIPFVRV